MAQSSKKLLFMLYSMTGYGRSVRSFGDKTITVEVRALNSKMTDIRFKMPNNYKEKEIEMRRILTERAERGKIDMSINVRTLTGEDDFILNHDLFRRYYRELTQLRAELGMEHGDVMQAILRLPNVIGSDDDSVPEEQWQATLAAMDEALKEFSKFRATEGAVMAQDMRERIALILSLLAQVAPYEKERVVKLRQRMRQNLDEFLAKENVDENRYEQEVLFYLEKIDVTEEKVRLEQHCRYFSETLNDKKNSSKGKTLNFISQEIGREINTLGSKAYSADIQHLVVQMKDELEKIKEQVANLV
jgi:uncharacterized protein (TIGR00255 family)